MAQSYDVIVIGLGGLDSAACYHLAKRGLRVVGLEQFEAVHARGASHGESRAVWQAYFMGPAYVPLLQRAYALWDELGAMCGEQLLTRTGGLCLGSADRPLVSNARASARDCGLTHEYLDADEIHARYPAFAPGEGIGGVYDPGCGYVRPEHVVRTHLRLAKQAGAVLNFGEAVLECTSSSRGTGVRTSKQTYKADQLVVCAGAWAPRLLPELAMQIQVLRKVMVWFDPIADAEDFLPGRYPYWIWEEDGTIGYGHPAVDGVYGGVKVGIHSGGILTDPDRVDRFVRAEDVDEIRNFITGRIPNLNGQYVRSAVCHYDNTPDRNFIIGPVPGDEKVIVAAGTSGHAFKFVPAIAEVISDLVTTGNSREDIALFESGRFSNTGRRT